MEKMSLKSLCINYNFGEMVEMFIEMKQFILFYDEPWNLFESKCNELNIKFNKKEYDEYIIYNLEV